MGPAPWPPSFPPPETPFGRFRPRQQSRATAKTGRPPRPQIRRPARSGPVVSVLQDIRRPARARSIPDLARRRAMLIRRPTADRPGSVAVELAILLPMLVFLA